MSNQTDQLTPVEKNDSTPLIVQEVQLPSTPSATEGGSEAPKLTSSLWHTISISISCFFIIVATVLGTGILALPFVASLVISVKVAKTGFFPFLVSIGSCMVMQVFIMIYMIELLQRTQAVQQHLKDTPPVERVESQQKEEEDDSQQKIALVKEKQVTPAKFLSEGPDLHTMGKLFLHRSLQVFFDFCVIWHFVAILITYSLAGPTAYAQLFGVKDYMVYFISPFVIILSLVVIFGFRIIRQIITFATLGKGMMLVVMVALVGIVGFSMDIAPYDDWRYIGRPFLITTVALGGAMNTLPVIYAKLIPTRRNVRMFQLAAVSAIVICTLINITWVLFVLKIVPQEDTEDKPSLHRSADRGEISTVPVIEIIDASFPQYKWLGLLVQIFIITSITVSFITMSSGLKHMLDGYVKTFQGLLDDKSTLLSRSYERVSRWIKHPSTLFQFGLYACTFLSILAVAQINPSKFFVIMEVFASASLNLESGFFVALMLWTSKRYYGHVEIPLPLPGWVVHTFWVVAAYFLFAVLYDFAYHLAALFVPEMPF